MAVGCGAVRAWVETYADVSLSEIDTDDLVAELARRQDFGNLVNLDANGAEDKIVSWMIERGYDVTKLPKLELSTAATLRDPGQYRIWLAEQRRLGAVAPPRTGA